jgi:TIR domain
MRGGVFICYRREDTAGFAGRIYDRLKSSLGRESVFIDVDNIPAGRDFVEVLSERVGRCDALVALIGRNWLASADKDNRRRLDDPNDFVRIEIEAALERNVPVIPVLVDGAAMPQANDLPDALKKLARRQGIEISHNRFDSDAERLTEALAGIDGEKPAQPSASLNAGAALPMAAAKPVARRVLLAVAALILIAAGSGFFYEYRGALEETARQEEKAKPTSDVLGILPRQGRPPL